MKVILLHNAKAGQNDRPEADQLLRALRDAGHTIIYQSTRQKGAKWALLESVELVIAAGGDGTVRKATLAVAGTGIPVAILPLGTANNLAKAFGITGNFSQIIHGLDTAGRARLEVGIASGPWGKTPFIESAGAGLLARVISCMSQAGFNSAAPSLERAHAQLRELLKTYPAQTCFASVDGQEFSEELLLVEAMNIPSAGPNIRLAPQAEPGDGLLDFVFLKESERAKFGHFLDSPTAKREKPPVEIIRGRTLHLRLPDADPIHVDDFTWPEEERQADSAAREDRGAQPIALEIHLSAEPVEVLVPHR